MVPVGVFSKITLSIYAILFFLIPSLREVVKWSPNPGWFVLFYNLAFAGFLWFIFSTYFWLVCRRKVLVSLVPYLVLASWAIAAFLIYPIADQRSEIGLGTTADDAMVVTAVSFFSGSGMYSPTLQGAAPISPGPAWIIINSPLAISGLIWLIVPLYGVISIFICRNLGPSVIFCTLLLLSSSVVFWNLMVVGHDLMAIGFGLLGFVVFGYKMAERKQIHLPLLLIYSVLLGIFCTSRVLFLVFPFVVGLLLVSKGLRSGWFVMISSLVVASAWHIGFYLVTDYYEPLHVVGRGYHATGGALFGIGFLFCGMSFIFLRALGSRGLVEWLTGVLLVFGVPLVFVSFGELFRSGFVLRSWEAANYLAVLSPVAAVTIGLVVSGKAVMQK